MDLNAPEDDAANAFKDALQIQGPSPETLDQDKKSLFWTAGVMDCFSTVFSLFSRADLKPAKDGDWEVPFESITDLVYLGSGAQGVVFGGNLRGEMVAVKKLRDKSETNIKHLRKLNHENIVRFRGVCSQPPCYCVVMEYCQYGPLFEFLHSGACFAPKQILKWAKEVAYGMTYLHQHKIIHRDLKSPNILIADNLVVKVSDFGTSREWNDVSAIMSFTGTVAWMAPEVIRHEPCSERVDVWSYGVVLWELLTQEIPYKNLETHAIMWGVGTDTISLPIPTTCPDSLQLLLNQCWNRVPRNRPPFKIIAAHLEIAGEELSSIKADCFSATQTTWRKEVQDGMDKFYVRSEQPQSETNSQRREELKHARDVRQVYEQQLTRANELYMEVCAVRLQLEQKERALAEREKALKACRCGVRKGLKYYNRQTSSSSDGVKGPLCLQALAEASHRRRNKKKPEPAQVVVNFVENKPDEAQNVTVSVDDGTCECEGDNNNIDTVVLKETVVEKNGNIDVLDTQIEKAYNDNYIPDVAQV
ncbi:mitogen-activated protein kinase kinase kinase 12 [Pectinophora gossypiella]|uniref:mitogen-activated protein kinase kinase kinase 12 n=1 Tax=Pectinophora gossypiella TaxID=13191 RepID=UPI00214F4801|nr:mitogen-activated protein kinase kinase kinase 12 [Pectinophora gossypiella]